MFFDLDQISYAQKRLNLPLKNYHFPETMERASHPELSTPARYVMLDGLRGVAALVVMFYHVGEGFATSSVDQVINHGYLAVDFFFMLSGFVIGYAYDGRWKGNGLTKKEFFRRRLIRLHPMLIFGVLLGLIAFAIQGFVQWDGTPVAAHWALIATLLTILFIPALPGAPHDIRGNGEMFPINGPAWSLFFEYIGNIAYALILRKLPTRALGVVVILSAIGLIVFSVGNLSGSYHLGVGWSLGDWNFLGGMLRLGFGFSAGLMMARLYKPRHIRGAFWICTALIVLLLSVPFVGNIDGGTGWFNGLYDAACVVLIFPLLLYIGASGRTTEGTASHHTCDWLGRISYPVYIIHYPLMYLFYAWVWGEGIAFADAWPVGLAVIAASIIVAWLTLKFYDEPLRRRLSRRGR